MNMPLRDDTGFEDKNSISFGEIPVKIQFPRAVTFDYYHQLISCERVMGVGKMIQEKRAGEKSRPMSKKKVVPKMAFGRRVPDKETKPTKGKPLRSKRVASSKKQKPTPSKQPDLEIKPEGMFNEELVEEIKQVQDYEEVEETVEEKIY